MRTADGRRVGAPCSWRSATWRPTRSLDGLVVTGYDISELADVRDRLRASGCHLNATLVVATLAEGVIVVDRDGVCRDANPSAARLLGLTCLRI